VRDGLLDHWRESYVCETRQVNEAWGVGETSEGVSCRKIAITLKIPQ
jgi:hypothetical protein